MKDYHIYAHYMKQGTAPKTSPKKQSISSNKTKTQNVEQEWFPPLKVPPIVNKIAGVSLATAHKINSYVGELTENRVAQRRVQMNLTMAGISLLAINNPVAGAVALASYVGNAGINYSIKTTKENLTADYLRQLSGGTVKTGR